MRLNLARLKKYQSRKVKVNFRSLDGGMISWLLLNNLKQALASMQLAYGFIAAT